ncbi:MAG TPA: quinone-dependent dihydroorotate dehydrogenase [Anaerolineales bacterium]|nr:quinone-dependent dihydroorotate dehydrogenase [Anaerolineales bacterium]
MYKFLRPLLFRLNSERAHGLTLQALRHAGNFPLSRWMLQRMYAAPSKPVQAFGLTFKNPIGLAAGYDKDGLAIRGLAALGFGHVEIGTVTPRPQPGNPSPRVFRLAEDEAVINRMGFPSLGAEYLQKQLSAMQGHLSVIVGVNLGKNKDTPNEEAEFDYLALLTRFAPYANYLTINVSSPNTAGLRDLQERKALENLLLHVHQQRMVEQEHLNKRIPVLVKLSPDMTEAGLDDSLEAILNTHMDGVIVTNTTLGREGLRSGHQRESGGLSGKPLTVKSEAVLRHTLKRVNGEIPVVSVGGVMNPEDAKRRLDMGAALVQVYTGLVYRGPALVKQIVKLL